MFLKNQFNSPSQPVFEMQKTVSGFCYLGIFILFTIAFRLAPSRDNCVLVRRVEMLRVARTDSISYSSCDLTYLRTVSRDL